MHRRASRGSDRARWLLPCCRRRGLLELVGVAWTKEIRPFANTLRGGVCVVKCRFDRALVGRSTQCFVNASWRGDDERAVKEADRGRATIDLPDFGLNGVGDQVDERFGA